MRRLPDFRLTWQAPRQTAEWCWLVSQVLLPFFTLAGASLQLSGFPRWRANTNEMDAKEGWKSMVANSWTNCEKTPPPFNLDVCVDATEMAMLNAWNIHHWTWTNQLEPRSSLTQVLPAALCLVVLRAAGQIGVGWCWLSFTRKLEREGQIFHDVYRFPIFRIPCSCNFHQNQSLLVRLFGFT